jgi:hypothetical protein
MMQKQKIQCAVVFVCCIQGRPTELYFTVKVFKIFFFCSFTIHNFKAYFKIYNTCKSNFLLLSRL